MDVKEEILNKIAVTAMKYGIDEIERFKGELYLILNDISLEKKTTELSVVNIDMNEMYLKKFLMSKTVKGCTKRTIEYYGQQLKKFMEELDKNVTEITPDDIRYYIAIKMHRDKCSDVTAGNMMRIISTFFEYMRREDYIRTNPMDKVDRIKEQKSKKSAFTEMEIEKMRAACKSNKERAIFEFMLSTGCRAAEICSVKIDDIKQDGTIKILGKGKKERYVYLNTRSQLAIESYLKERNDKNPYLFPKMIKAVNAGGRRANIRSSNNYTYAENVTKSEPMNHEGPNGYVKKIAKRAGVDGCHAHKFRRTCATMALKRGMPLVQVSKMLGHESMETTQIYLDISQEDLFEAHKKYVF